MSIPTSVDIVLDVARAADPEKYREAVQRLTEMRAVAADAQPATVPASSEQRVTSTFSRAIEANTARPEVVRPRGRLNAYGQFEAFLLQTFVQSMLPKKATNVYGKGTAGEVWRSMLAERIGEELAKSGQVGIAARLESPARQAPSASETAAPSAVVASVHTLSRPEVPQSIETDAEAARWAASTQLSTDRS